MDVQRLDPSDLDVVRPAWLALCEYLGTLDTGMGPLRDRAELWTRRRRLYERWLAAPESAIFVAREDGELLGYAMLQVKPPWTVRFSTDPTFELETLSVMPGARGRGVGGALWAAAAAHARGCTTLVGVSTVNEAAVRFYLRQGFRPFTSTWWARPVPDWAAPAGPRITAVTASEIDELEPLQAELGRRHAEVGPDYLPPQRPYAAVWPLHREEMLADNRVVLRAGEDGFVNATYSENGFDVWNTGPVGYVEALAVRPEARGRGLGRELLAAAAHELRSRGARALELEVLEGNDDAARLYARLGFRRVFETLVRG
jgi:ribosomal protein S18 acetylase RimI-like enzyme